MTHYNLEEAILNYGSSDVGRAEDIIGEAELDISEVGQYIADYANNVGTLLSGLDVVALVYDFILQKVRDEVDNYNNNTELADLDVSVAGNYLATSYDGTGNLLDKAKVICQKVPKDKQSPALVWFINQL